MQMRYEFVRHSLACAVNVSQEFSTFQLMQIIRCDLVTQKFAGLQTFSYIPPVAMRRVSKLTLLPFLKVTELSKVSTSVASIPVWTSTSYTL